MKKSFLTLTIAALLTTIFTGCSAGGEGTPDSASGLSIQFMTSTNRGIAGIQYSDCGVTHISGVTTSNGYIGARYYPGSSGDNCTITIPSGTPEVFITDGYLTPVSGIQFSYVGTGINGYTGDDGQPGHLYNRPSGTVTAVLTNIAVD